MMDPFSELEIDDPPPTYDSVFGKIKQAKSENEGNKFDLLRKLYRILSGGVVVTILLAFTMAVPVAMIVIGSLYVHDCPAQRFIPIYLIVAGVFAVVRGVSSTIQRCLNHRKGEDEENSNTNPLDGLLGCFLFAWFIAGNVWIFGLYSNYGVTWQDSDPYPTADPILMPTEAPLAYCHHTLYWFSFWVTTSTYIMLCFSCCCCCCAVLIAALATCI